MSVPPGPFEDQPTQQLFSKAPAGAPAVPPADEPDDGDLLEPDWEQPRRFSRLTIALAIGILVVLAFAGGAFVAGGSAAATCQVPSGPPATTTSS